jgi:hypothetical protein
VTQHGFDEDHEPLLVRRFLLPEAADDTSPETWPSTTPGESPAREADDLQTRPSTTPGGSPAREADDLQTWSSATSEMSVGDVDDEAADGAWLPGSPREIRSHRAAAGTPVAPAGPDREKPTQRRRRVLVVTGTGVAVLLAAAASAYAALRPDVRPSVSAALPGAPLPAASGPAPTSAAPASRASSASSASPSAHRSASRSASAGPSATTAGAPAVATAGEATAQPLTPSPAPTDAGGDGNGNATVDPVPPSDAFAPQPPVARTGTIRARNNLCLDLNGGVAADDNHIQVYECNGTDAQRWTLATDGTLGVLDKCAFATGDATVHIVTCDGRTPAQWRTSGQTVVNAANGFCLTDPSNGAGSGTAVTVTSCSGAPNQSWFLP